MKHLLIICSLLLTSVIWSEDIEWLDLVERNGVRYKKFSDVPFTGKITSGIYQGELIDGKNEGAHPAANVRCGDSGGCRRQNCCKTDV